MTELRHRPVASAPVTARLGRATAWNGAAQAIYVVGNVVLTPFLLHRLGPSRYGLVGLALTTITFLAYLDGGLGTASMRMFSVSFGRGDRAAVTRLLLAICLFLVVVAALLSLLMLPLAPAAAELLHASTSNRNEAVLLLRICPPLVALVTVRNVLVAVLNTDNNWRATMVINTSSVTAYVAVAVLLVDTGHGLHGVVVALVVQQTLATAVAFGYCLPRLAVPQGWLPGRAELVELGGYAWRLQLSGLATFVQIELDALIIAALFPVQDVGYYAIGAGVAVQLMSLATNGLSPIAARLGQVMGAGGRRAAIDEYTRLVHLWTRLSSVYACVAAVCVWFGVYLWLGASARLPATVAAVLMLGYAAALMARVGRLLVTALGHPALETRASFVGVAVNLVLTLPLALALGVTGVVVATALSWFVTTGYFQLLLKRELGSDHVSIAAILPWRWCLGLSLLAGLLEVGVLLTRAPGVLGLLAAGVPAAVALVVFARYGLGLPVSSPRRLKAALARL